MSLPLVAVIGRPNVGKSSLFNRFLNKRIAIVDDTPGVTRDRNYGRCEWNGREFYLVDTGGIIPDSRGGIEKLVLEQSQTAIEQADLAVLVVDCQVGIDRTEEMIASKLLKSGKDVLLLANKADNDMIATERFEFMKLGLGEPIAVSAVNGFGIGDALDEIVASLPEAVDEEIEDETIRIAVIGKPNVGKSSFINRLIGQERVIVSPVPGTTRDAIDTPFEFEGKNYVLVDTAGLRKKAKVTEDLEFFTNLRTIRAIEDCHVALVLVDGSEGLTVQDLKVIEDAIHARRAIVLGINKWDLVDKDHNTADVYTEQIKKFVRTVAFIPIVYISALSGKRVVKVLSYIHEVFDNWHRKISTSELNKFTETIVQKQPPAAVQGKHIKLFYVTQAGIRPPSFLFFCNYPKLIKKSYIRYIENQLRSQYDFEGVPIRIRFKERK